MADVSSRKVRIAMIDSIILQWFEMFKLIQQSPLQAGVYLLMFIILELPLILLALIGLLKWYPQQQRVSRNLASYQSTVSCVITCYSEGAAIKSTIISLLEQCYRGPIEIIAVIDGAKQNTDSLAAAESCQVLFEGRDNRQLIILPKWQRGGRVSTLNAGLSVASGDIIMNADGDTSFDNDMLQQALKIFDNPDIKAIGATLRVRNATQNIITRMQNIEYLFSMQAIKTGLNEWGLLNNISGAFGLFRKEFLVTIGSWDTHTAEDLDLTLRIKHYFARYPNVKIGFAPLAIGHTDVPDTLTGLLQQRLRWDGDLLFIYLRKHIRSLTPKLLGWKTFIYTMVYGVFQGVIFPILIFVYLSWILFTYPPLIIIGMLSFVYVVYFSSTLFLYIIFLIAVSERKKLDRRAMMWLFVFPIYSVLMKLWSVRALLREVFQRSHEDSAMAPWWVLKKGKRF